MKTISFSKKIIALAVVVAASAGPAGFANDQPAPPPPSDNVLPANIPTTGPLAEVFKLVQAGVDASVIKGYIANSASTFNLDAEKILVLTDAGVPTDIIDAMLAHDKNFSAPAAAPAPAAPAGTENYSADTAPPATEVTVNYFNDTLSPYGSWVEVDGYGRCWRPTTVVYDSNWRPYCDRGHWVYTDCGWYWNSDYSWGATFHYGRWFQHPRYGWCWWPDTVWGPSWVSWRQSDAYCGWAPLPPFSVYRPGLGFYYRGAHVAVGFDFGISADYYTFVSYGHFYERHPRYYREDRDRGRQIFHQTTIINNYGDHNRVIVNGGISVDRIRGATHRQIQPVAVRELPNAVRQGWRGEGSDRGGNRPGQSAPNHNSPNNSGQSGRNDHNNNSGGINHQGSGQPVRNDAANPTTRPTSPGQPGHQNDSRERNPGNRNSTPPTSAPQNVNPPANNNHSPGSTYNREVPQRSTPPVNRTLPERSQPQATPPTAPPRSEHSGAPQNDWRQGRNVTTPAPVAPPQRSMPQIEQRQFTPPARCHPTGATVATG
jgi:hypothetical protein